MSPWSPWTLLYPLRSSCEMSKQFCCRSEISSSSVTWSTSSLVKRANAIRGRSSGLYVKNGLRLVYQNEKANEVDLRPFCQIAAVVYVASRAMAHDR